MKVYLASDHAGFKLKDELIPYIKSLGYDAIDLGPFAYDATDDYPDFIKLAAKAVSDDPEARGVILGASGQGEAFVANKFRAVRAVVYYGVNREIIKLSRNHNDANVLSLGARFLNEKEAKDMVKLWLGAKFSEDERHVRRLKKVAEIEKTAGKGGKTRLTKLLRFYKK